MSSLVLAEGPGTPVRGFSTLAVTAPAGRAGGRTARAAGEAAGLAWPEGQGLSWPEGQGRVGPAARCGRAFCCSAAGREGGAPGSDEGGGAAGRVAKLRAR